jgi:integrase
MTLRFQALLRAAGLPKWTFHQLRHACGSLLVAMGTHPRVVMEVLGHSNIQTAMNVYAHVTPALRREAVDRLGALLSDG